MALAIRLRRPQGALLQPQAHTRERVLVASAQLERPSYRAYTTRLRGGSVGEVGGAGEERSATRVDARRGVGAAEAQPLALLLTAELLAVQGRLLGGRRLASLGRRWPWTAGTVGKCSHSDLAEQRVREGEGR